MADMRYWAAEDTDVALRGICERRDWYYQWLRTSQHVTSIRRNWDYYHNARISGRDDMAIEVVGEEGQMLRISVPHFRTFLLHILAYVTQNRPAWDTRVTNPDHKSKKQAELGNQVLDYYMDDPLINIERRLKRAVEHGVVLSTGYVKACWDIWKGEEVGGDPATGQIFYSGDLSYSNPTLFDVAYDLYSSDWDSEVQWCSVRHRENRWDLIRKYPFVEDEILHAQRSGQPRTDEPLIDLAPLVKDTDLVDVWTFYHKKTLAMPEGRELCFLDRRTWLHDSLTEGIDFRYKTLPVFRIQPAEMLGTTLGHTPAFDMQGCQEAINAEASMMISQTNATGPGIIAAPRGTIAGAGVEPTKGLRFLEYDGDKPPAVLDLEKAPDKRIAVMEVFHKQMQLLSGINAVALGQPEANVRAGSAMALLEAKALQFSAPITASYYELMANVGTATLCTLRDYMGPENKKAISIIGLNQRREVKWFGGSDLEPIERVVVQPGNPVMRLSSGRVSMAETLLQGGMIKTPEEYITVVKTGDLKSLTEVIDAQLDIIHDENDIFLQGGKVPDPMDTDYHALHAPKHMAVINSVEARLDFDLVARVMAHLAIHLNFMNDPGNQMVQMALGYPTAVPPMPHAGGKGITGLPPGMAQEPGVTDTSAPGGTKLNMDSKNPRLEMDQEQQGAA